MRIVALDPSVNNVGWAIYDSEKAGKAAWSWGTWKLGGDNYQRRLADLVDRMSDQFDSFHILITEWPTFFDSQRGHVAARQNYTVDLAGICGYVAGRFNLDHRTWYKVTATEWKGTVSKEITQRKFFRVFKVGLNTTSEHAIDAVMLLQYWLGMFGEACFESFGDDWVRNDLIYIK